MEEKLYTNLSYPSQEEIIALAETGSVFDFLHDEPNLYSLEDGIGKLGKKQTEKLNQTLITAFDLD